MANAESNPILARVPARHSPAPATGSAGCPQTSEGQPKPRAAAATCARSYLASPRPRRAPGHRTARYSLVGQPRPRFRSPACGGQSVSSLAAAASSDCSRAGGPVATAPVRAEQTTRAACCARHARGGWSVNLTRERRTPARQPSALACESSEMVLYVLQDCWRPRTPYFIWFNVIIASKTKDVRRV